MMKEPAEIGTFLLLSPHSQPTWSSPFTFARSPIWEACRGAVSSPLSGKEKRVYMSIKSALE